MTSIGSNAAKEAGSVCKSTNAPSDSKCLLSSSLVACTIALGVTESTLSLTLILTFSLALLQPLNASKLTISAAKIMNEGFISRGNFLQNDEHVHHYQRERASIMGLGL